MSKCELQIVFDREDRTYRGGEEVTGTVYVRVEERHAAASGHVLPDESFKQRRLARARLSDNVGVVEPRSLGDAEHSPLIAEIRSAEQAQPLLFP